MTLEEKRNLIYCYADDSPYPHPTLNGRPAMIIGAMEPHAVVWAWSDDKAKSQIQAIYAWPTVKHIMENCGGEFTA